MKTANLPEGENKNDLSNRVYQKMWEKDYFSQWMGLKMITVGKGHCKFSYRVRKEMLNGFGMLHGGILFSAADSAFAFACNSHGRISVALDVSVTFTKPAKLEEELYVEAMEVYLGNKTAVYEVKTNNYAGDLIAIFKGTCYRTSNELDV